MIETDAPYLGFPNCRMYTNGNAKNLTNYSITRGGSLSLNSTFSSGLRINLGVTFLDNYIVILYKSMCQFVFAEIYFLSELSFLKVFLPFFINRSIRKIHVIQRSYLYLIVSL